MSLLHITVCLITGSVSIEVGIGPLETLDGSQGGHYRQWMPLDDSIGSIDDIHWMAI